jgi:hypothetical protein
LLTFSAGQSNFEYFMAEKSHRVRILQTFFATNLGIELLFTGQSIYDLGTWLFGNGRYLLPVDSRESMGAILYFEPDWVGHYRGMNVINDIGIFIGEYVITYNNNVRWGLYKGESGADRDNVAYLQPSLIGITEPYFAVRNAVYVTDEILQLCWRSRDRHKFFAPGAVLYDEPSDLRKVADGLANIKPMNTYLRVCPESFPYGNIALCRFSPTSRSRRDLKESAGFR